MPRPGKAERTKAWVALRGLGGTLWPRVLLDTEGAIEPRALPPVTPEQLALASELRQDVEGLALGVGPRNVYLAGTMDRAAAWCRESLSAAGLGVREQRYSVQHASAGGAAVVNIEGAVPGTSRADEIVVVGAHYDSVRMDGGCPGANDNGSGVAAVLALARRWSRREPARTVRFVLFANEEPPFFWTRDMGSLVYADACRARCERIVGMLTPETIGCYSDEPGSQRLPLLGRRRLPSVGNFIAFVGMWESRGLVAECVREFRRRERFPAIGAAMPAYVPGVGASDHWSFWRCGFPALMVTDTAPFRYPWYHTADDTPEKLDYERMARVVEGLDGVLTHLAGE